MNGEGRPQDAMDGLGGGTLAHDPFALLFGSHPQPMWVYDLATLQFLAVNDAAVTEYGYDRATFLRMRITDIRPEAERARLLENVAQWREAREAAGRWQHRRADGTLLDVEITSHTIEFDGRTAVLVLVTDVSEQVQAEAVKQRLEDRFSLIFQESPAALVISRLTDGTFLDLNRSYEALVGWTRQDLIGRSPLELDVYPSHEERQEMVRRLQETGSLRNFATQIRTKSGDLRHILTSLHLLEMDGEPCLISVVIDVTEQHEAQEALQARERELAFLAEASRIVNSSLDYGQTLQTVAELAVPQIADWCAVHILDENGSARELAATHTDPTHVGFARTPQQTHLPNAVREGVIQPELSTGQPRSWSELINAMLAAGAPQSEHLDLMRRLGLSSVLVMPLIAREQLLGTLTLVCAESGRQFGPNEKALAQDLAQRAAIAVDNARLFRDLASAEEELRTLNAELERRVAARTVQLEAANAELEAFSYSVSHDLRAPLRSVDGFSKVLATRYGAVLDERGLHYLSTIREAAQEMGQLIDALLRLARLSRSEMCWTEVDVSAIARSIAGALTQQQPERDVVFSLAEGVTVLGDEHLLRALLENLLSNACKFSRDRAPARITFGVDRQGEETVYSVRDNGAGFDHRYAHKLFGPFQRLHRVTEFEGTGIGLATVQRIVHRHGGRVWADGAIDQGATISFTLGTSEEHAP